LHFVPTAAEDDLVHSLDTLLAFLLNYAL